jgi:tetratricopeptide (TPR) repeat protein
MDIPKNYAIKRDYWVSIMGKGFEHMHHYCRAQTNVLRSRKAGLTMQERTYLREKAVDDYRYVTKNAEPDFILLPEIYTRIGEVEILRGNPADANKAFAQARQMKPDYWPAYSNWAEYLMSHGQRAEALKIVRSGLQQSPDAKVLLELLRILGGKPSDIPGKPVETVQNVVNPSVKETVTSPDDSKPAETGLANKDSPLQSKP